MWLRQLQAVEIRLIKEAAMSANCVLINIFGYSYFDDWRNGSCSPSFDWDVPPGSAHGKSSRQGR
jgi:hypothetical protein